MRYLGFLLLLLGCGGLGLSFAEDYTKRILILKQIQKMLYYVGDRILTEKDTLPEAFFHTSSRFDGKWKQFFKEMYEETEKLSGSTLEEIWREKSILLKGEMEEQDFLLFQDAMKQTGFGSEHGQLGALKEYQYRIEEILKELTEQKKEKCKLYRSLGFMGGILMIVILW